MYDCVGCHRQENQMYSTRCCASLFLDYCPIRFNSSQWLQTKGLTWGKRPGDSPCRAEDCATSSNIPLSSPAIFLPPVHPGGCMVRLSVPQCLRWSQAVRDSPLHKQHTRTHVWGNPALQKSSKNIISILSPVMLKWRPYCALLSPRMS